MLRIEADADNPDIKPLPFGLGYHPYFSLASFGVSSAVLVAVGAAKIWELQENLPTGKTIDVDGATRCCRRPECVILPQLDDVMTDLYTFAYDQMDSLGMVGVLQHLSGNRMLTLWVGSDYRELVLFTPPHREAICLEPYTCTTDAINLTPRGVDAGLRVLQPGEHWQAVIEMHLADSR